MCFLQTLLRLQNIRRRLGAIVLFTLSLLVATGCATRDLIVGKSSTDLSTFRINMKREDIEKYLGKPSKLESWQEGTGIVAFYSYDRGFYPIAEEPGKRFLAFMFIFPLDVFSLGVFGLRTACFHECQIGRLKVIYNVNNRLIGAKELPSERIGRCWTKGRCGEILYYPPSTLPLDIKTSGDSLN